MLTLGIETSCDETSVALLRGADEIVVNLISSQFEAHKLFGGVVPEIASRKHLEVLNPLLHQAQLEANIGWREIDLIAVTNGPGLVGALLVGVAAAKALSYSWGIPCLPVNHIEGHIASCFLARPDLQFPMLCLVVSGGHSDIVLVSGHGDFKRLGRTRDDAVGEAFDKVARAVGLPQPGGPALEEAAKAGDRRSFAFKASQLGASFDFSFSGLKTAAAQAAAKNPGRGSDIAASFQATAVRQLRRVVEAALEVHQPRTLGLCGGVAANEALRNAVAAAAAAAGIAFVVPEAILCTDNAAMIAAAGYYQFVGRPIELRAYSIESLEFEAHSLLPVAGP